jgi:hypothetical protein
MHLIYRWFQDSLDPDNCTHSVILKNGNVKQWEQAELYMRRLGKPHEIMVVYSQAKADSEPAVYAKIKHEPQ